MDKIKQRVAVFLSILFIGCFCVNAVPASASEISASSEPAIGTFGTHSMSKIGSTRNHDHTLWKHWVSYGAYTTNYKLYAYCMSYGYKASNIRSTGVKVINWPYSSSKKQILSYAASYVVNHKDKYNYFAMQGISWATIGMSKGAGGRWYRDTGNPLITMGYNDDLEYTTQEPIFSPEADEFVANLIIQDDGNKDITEDNGDICPTCGGYGYLWQYYMYSYWGYYNEYDSDSGDSTSGPYTFTQKQNDQGFIADNTDEHSYYGDSYGSWNGHYPTDIQKVECPNSSCDLENYWDGDYSGATVDENDSEKTWKAYCEMKYYIHLMSQVPSYSSKSKTTALKEENIIHLKWTGLRYEVNLSDTNCVTAQHQLTDIEESASDSDDYGYYFTDGHGYHFKYVKGWTKIWYNGSTDPDAPCNIDVYKNDVAQKVTVFSTICSAMKEKTGNVAYWNNVTSSQWQDFMTIYEEHKPTTAYIAVTVDSPYLCDVGCSTENDIKIYDLDGNEVEYIIPGEKYKLRYTFSYSGGSKGYGLKQVAGYTKDIDYYRVVDRYGDSAYTNYYSNYSTYVGDWFVPYMKKLTDVTLNGKYSVFNMPYKGESTTWNSDEEDEDKYSGSHYDTNWNVKLYIDAFDLKNTITSCIENNESWGYWKKGTGYQIEQYTTDAGYEAWRVTSKNAVTEQKNSTATEELDQAYYMQVERINADDENPEIKITWQYETPYQVFKAPLCDAESFIFVPKSENSTKYFPEKRYDIDMNGRYYQKNGGTVREMNGSNYTKRYYNMACSVTKNAAYDTNSSYYKQWKLLTDIKVTQFHASSGDGITSPVDILSKKYLNYQFYYGVSLTNDEATVKDYFYRKYSKRKDGAIKIFYKDTSGDTYQGNTVKDTNENLNTYKSKKLIGLNEEVEIQTDVSTQLKVNGVPYINLDHIHTGTTLIQRTLPVVVQTNQAGRKDFAISVNVDDEEYSNTKNGFRTFYETEFDSGSKENNAKEDFDPIVKAINPANESECPVSIFRMDNINSSVSVSNRTAYRIMLDGNYIQVYDTFGLGYDDKNYNFDEYSRTNGSYSKTDENGNIIKYSDWSFKYAPYYKYSSTKFRTLKENSWVTSNEDLSNYKQDDQDAVESYRISKVLFRSNYTDKYMKQPDVTETDETGHDVTNWVDLAEDQNRAFRDKKAKVAAGQGFELKVQVTYTNNNLIEYLDKTVDKYAAANHDSNTMSSKLSYIGKQYANHFYGTIYDGSQTSIGELRDMDGNQVEIYGSNIYEDLYASISENEETAYSYSGIGETMQIWDMDKDVNCDYANNRITIVYTYTLRSSKSNGIFGRFQKMKFYTNQLAPDSKEGDAESKKHYINLWTAVFPALEIDDDMRTDAWNFDTETRYLGDVTKLEYLISSTAADDSIVHIVQ